MRHYIHFTTLTLTLRLGASAQEHSSLPDPIICEDTLDGSPPFRANQVPCLIGCGVPVAVPTGSLLPGSVNATDIPYCQLDCVRGAGGGERGGATPEQSAVAPECYGRCQVMNQGTPENQGWCMYWCVAGFGDVVESTKCVPSLVWGDYVTTTDHGRTLSFRPFTQPTAWQSWYQTQTVLPVTPTPGSGGQGTVPTATSNHPITAAPSSSGPSFSAPFRVSSEDPKTETSVSTADAEQAQSTGSGEGVTSPTPTPTPPNAAGRLSTGVLLQVFSSVGVWVIISLI
ncbi:hypothetical protein F5Y04DRAFT_111908 [Hypomontagnella monticulosa]|nr:hypothetical protein F5Y04DRAFT_111908 [Hypomontagnella monticulosa]